MKTLASIQSAFQRSVLDGDRDIPEDVTASPRAPAEALFGVYRDAYVARLTELLGNDFPKLQTLMGDRDFADLCRHYAVEQPSRVRNARWYGAGLAAYLREKETWRTRPLLAEMADLEWALGLAFDAPDLETASATSIGSISPEDWPGLRFVLHSSVTLLDCPERAPAVWLNLDAEAEDASSGVDRSSIQCLVWRQAGTARFRLLPGDEADALRLIRDGVTFARLCEALAEQHEAEAAARRAAGLMHIWLESELIHQLIAESGSFTS